MTYTPRPLDTAAVTIPPALAELIEQLAVNAHEVFVSRRLAEGWRHGPKRDDDRRENPTMVPYDDLPEREKDVDREMVAETVKVILTLGYRIEKR